MTKRFLSMIQRLSIMENIDRVDVNQTPTSLEEMKTYVKVYSRNDDGTNTELPFESWGFDYADVISKEGEIQAEAMSDLRKKRNQLLEEADKKTLECYSKGVALPLEWSTYQQSLRDLPANSTPDYSEDGELIGVTWPTKP